MRIKGYPSERLNNTEILSHRKTKNGLTGKFYESSREMAKHQKKVKNLNHHKSPLQSYSTGVTQMISRWF